MGIFGRRQASRPRTTPQYAKLVEARQGDLRTLMLLNPASGTTTPFPPIDLLLRSTGDLQRMNSALAARGAGDADLPLSESVVPGVVSTLGLDQGDRFVTLTASHLAEMGITRELAESGARARLRTAASGLQIEGSGGRFRLHLPSNPDLTASFMLIADAWLTSVAIDGDPIFAVGSRAFLHVCGSKDREAMDGLRAIATTMHRDSTADPQGLGQPLTPDLLLLRENRLSVVAS